MAELYISRVKFPKGRQRAFILNTAKKLQLAHSSLASLVGVSPRTLTDWKREKFLMNVRAAKILSRKSRIPLPKNVEIKNPFWYITHESSLKGWRAVYRKYGRVPGDPEYRKVKWQEWWDKEGQFKPSPVVGVRLPIKKPKKSEILAEFVGIILGDGGISARQVIITLNRVDDMEYINFLTKLIKRLFGIKPGIHHRKDSVADAIVISRIELVDYCTKYLGLKSGNKVKQQVDIPGWIKRNRKFRLACVRGLIDTDGSIFTHSYKVNGKLYNYKKLAFTSASEPLVKSVYGVLQNAGLKPRIAQRGRDIRLDSTYDMRRYFRLIGSHNPKHLKRYKN